MAIFRQVVGFIGHGDSYVNSNGIGVDEEVSGMSWFVTMEELSNQYLSCSWRGWHRYERTALLGSALCG